MRIPVKKIQRAGPQERQRLLQAHGQSIAAEERDLRELSAEERAAGHSANESLCGDGPRSAAKRPLFLASLAFGFALVGTLATAHFFNNQTLNLEPVAAVTVTLGLPLAIMGTKAAKAVPQLGRFEELPALAENALRELVLPGITATLAFVLYGVARYAESLPESVAFFGLMVLELALCFCCAPLLILVLVYSRAPLHFRAARRYERAANRLAPFAAMAADVPQLTGPEGPPVHSNSQNGSTSATTATPRAAGALGRAGGPVLALALACLGATACRADMTAQTIAIYLDRTPSVAELPEFNDVAKYVASSLPRLFALDSLATSVELYSWTGNPLSSRVPTQRWAVPPLPVVDHKSVFKRRQERQRLEALRQREANLEAVGQAIVAAAAQSADSVGQSCIWALLKDARASQALTVVITDAVVACRGDAAPAASSANGRVLVVVTASASDGAAAADRVAERVARLQALGFFAVNAREIRARDWSTLFQDPGNLSPRSSQR